MLRLGPWVRRKVKEAAGFVVNRILIPMINEAVGILADGVASVEGMEEGQLASWKIKIDGQDIAVFTVQQNGSINEFDEDAGVGIQNTKISSLPSTGGIGTTIFTIGGCAIMILAAGLYFASRRKSAK